LTFLCCRDAFRSAVPLFPCYFPGIPGK
jgi:hypothetical protein